MQLTKNAVRAAGINDSAYAGYSLRIGAATAATAAGMPAHFIKIFGRWESSAYQMYI